MIIIIIMVILVLVIMFRMAMMIMMTMAMISFLLCFPFLPVLVLRLVVVLPLAGFLDHHGDLASFYLLWQIFLKLILAFMQRCRHQERSFLAVLL